MIKTLSKWNALIITACFLWCGGGCTDAEDDGKDIRTTDGLIHIETMADYTVDNHTYILSDDEPEEIFLNSAERSFDPRHPLQLSITENRELFLRAYSPRRIKNMKIWATIDGYPEKFLLAWFEILPPFIEFRQKLPFIDADKDFPTANGKIIRIMANPHISAADLSLEMECDDPYYKMFSEIKTTWWVNFSKFEGVGYWAYPMKPGHCREAVAMTLNAAYMFSSPEYEQKMKEYNGRFYSNGSGHGPGGQNGPVIEDNKVLIEQARWHYNGIAWGHVNGVGGLGGGKVLGLTDGSYVSHYADDTGECMAWFHEFGHGMGYGDSNNTIISNDGEGIPSWRKVCQELYRQMCIDKRLPIYSRRFMHSRRNYKFYSSGVSWSYAPSSAIIEDPELDELDGGLAGGTDFLATDLANDDGRALSFKLNHETAGVDAKNYAPANIYVYGDSLYLANDIRPKDASLDVYDISSGTPVLKKRIAGWKNPQTGAEEPFNKQVTAVLRSNGKLYATAGHIYVYDARTCEFLTKLEYTRNTLAAANGKLYAFSNAASVFPEHRIPATDPLGTPCFASTSNLGGNVAENSLASDWAGNVYALVCSSPGKMTRVNPQYIMAGKLLTDNELQLEANPTGAAWSKDGRLFVSFGGDNPKFCEVNPKNGKIVKDYTTVGGITLLKPTRCIIRRNTLFIVDRMPAWCVYAIPMSELK